MKNTFKLVIKQGTAIDYKNNKEIKILLKGDSFGE